jgi:hypothetical protein
MGSVDYSYQWVFFSQQQKGFVDLRGSGRGRGCATAEA